MKKTMLPFTLSLTGAAAIVGAVMSQSQGKPSQPGKPNTHNSSRPAPHHAPPHHAPARQTRPAVAASGELSQPLSPEARARGDEIIAYGEQINQQARALLREGKLDEAEEKCREEITFYQAHSLGNAGRRLLGEIQLAQGKYQDALDTYTALRQNNDDPQLYVSIALCYVRLNKLEEARKVLQAYPEEWMRKQAADPPPEDLKGMPGMADLKSMEATLMLTMATMAPDGYEEQLKYLLAAEKLAPKNALIADRIGEMLYRLERYEEGVLSYKREVQLGGKLSYRDQMRVEMFDLRKKQQDAQRAPVEPSAPH